MIALEERIAEILWNTLTNDADEDASNIMADLRAAVRDDPVGTLTELGLERDGWVDEEEPSFIQRPQVHDGMRLGSKYEVFRLVGDEKADDAGPTVKMQPCPSGRFDAAHWREDGTCLCREALRKAGQ